VQQIQFRGQNGAFVQDELGLKNNQQKIFGAKFTLKNAGLQD
jgi:hypothetical protein